MHETSFIIKIKPQVSSAGVILTQLMKKWINRYRNQQGITLIENLVAAAILAAIGVVFMSAIATGYRNVGTLNDLQTAEILIRSQLEYIKKTDFNELGEYSIVVDVPERYSMSINSTSPTCIGTTDNCVPLSQLVEQDPFSTIQEITVSVYHGSKLVLAVSCYKAIQ